LVDGGPGAFRIEVTSLDQGSQAGVHGPGRLLNNKKQGDGAF